MKSIKHWTPRYVWCRIVEAIDQRANPKNPWLTKESVKLIDELILPSDLALEFGGGRSTAWIARRVKHVTSVDDSPEWAKIVEKQIEDAGLTNTTLLLRPQDVEESDGAKAGYVRVVDQFEDNSLGFILVDGFYRGHCAVESLSKLKSGGVLAFDNVSWFLPSTSKTPGSRSLADGPRDESCRKFLELTNGWRKIWTDSGVTATLLVFKP